MNFKKVTAAATAAATLLSGVLFFGKSATAAANENLVILGDDLAVSGGSSDILNECFKNTVNFAKKGFKAEDLLNQIETDSQVRDALSKADKIVVSIGSNNILIPALEMVNQYSTDSDENFIELIENFDTTGINKEEMKVDLTEKISSYTLGKNILKIYEDLSAYNADIYAENICNPLDIDTNLLNDRGKSRLSQINGQVKKYIDLVDRKLDKAISNSSKIKKIDINSALAGHGDLFTGIIEKEIYPNDAGNAVIAAAIAKDLGEIDTKSETMQKTLSALPQNTVEVLKNMPLYSQMQEMAKSEDVTKPTTTTAKPTETSTVTTTTATVTTKPDVKPGDLTHIGDANLDGKITAEDATYILIDFANLIAGNEGILPMELADANQDGKITAEDATLVLIVFANAIAENTEVAHV